MRLRKVAIAAALTAGVSFYSLFDFPNRTTATAGTIVSSGVTRRYLLYVPKSYEPTREAATSGPADADCRSSWSGPTPAPSPRPA